MSFTWNVANNLSSVRQADTCDLPQSRVRLLWRRCVNSGADATLLRAALHSRNLVPDDWPLARLSDQLVYRRHSVTLNSSSTPSSSDPFVRSRDQNSVRTKQQPCESKNWPPRALAPVTLYISQFIENASRKFSYHQLPMRRAI